MTLILIPWTFWAPFSSQEFPLSASSLSWRHLLRTQTKFCLLFEQGRTPCLSVFRRKKWHQTKKDPSLLTSRTLDRLSLHCWECEKSGKNWSNRAKPICLKWFGFIIPWLQASQKSDKHCWIFHFQGNLSQDPTIFPPTKRCCPSSFQPKARTKNLIILVFRFFKVGTCSMFDAGHLSRERWQKSHPQNHRKPTLKSSKAQKTNSHFFPWAFSKEMSGMSSPVFSFSAHEPRSGAARGWSRKPFTAEQGFFDVRLTSETAPNLVTGKVFL